MVINLLVILNIDKSEIFSDFILYNYNEKLYKLWYIIEGGYYDKKRKKGSRI